MAAFIHNDDSLWRRSAVAFTLLLALRAAGAAELGQGELTYNADKINSQLRTDTMELIGNVSLSQGANSITAGKAHVQASGANNSQWAFEQSVYVRTAEGELRADTVSATIAKGQLATARAEGSPAEFQQLSGAPDGQGRGRANVIEYDVGDGIVKLTGSTEQVWFIYGKDQNEFRTDVLTYNMRTGTVSTGRTRGTIRLNNKPGATAESDGQDEPGLSPATEPGKREDGA